MIFFHLINLLLTVICVKAYDTPIAQQTSFTSAVQTTDTNNNASNNVNIQDYDSLYPTKRSVYAETNNDTILKDLN